MLMTRVPQKFCVEDYFCVLAELVRKERKRPHYFEGTSVTGTQYEKYNSHHADSKFFDYQKFGIDVTRPLVDWEQSEVLGAENLKVCRPPLAAWCCFMSGFETSCSHFRSAQRNHSSRLCGIPLKIFESR